MQPGCSHRCLIESIVPDELLETIFAMLGSERQAKQRLLAAADCGSTAPAADSSCLALVCHRWRRVYNSSALLHGTLNLDLHTMEEQLAGKDGALLLRLLEARGRAAHRLWLHSDGQRLRMEHVLRLMSPRLQAVYLGSGAPPGSLSQLCRFPSLRCLDLPCPPAGECQLLAGFSQLEELTLRDGPLGFTLSALASLPRLRLLSLTVTDALPADSHRQLARLSALEELHLYLQPSQPTQFEFQPGALAGLTRLRSLLLLAPGCLWETLVVGTGLPLLTSLQELQVECHVAALPQLWACRHLTRLDLDLKGSAALPAPASLASVSMPSLAQLRLARCRLQGGALPPVMCQLSALRRLELVKCGLTAACTHAFPPHLSRLSRLEHLSLEANMLCALPAAVAALPSLRHLDLSCNALAWLPQGPYLRRLETLILAANRVTQVPAVLAGAPCLEVLDLSGNMGLEVSLSDVRSSLAAMPRLALLLLGKQAACTLGMAAPAPGGLEWRTPSVAALVALGQALPHLQVDFERTAKEYEGV